MAVVYWARGGGGAGGGGAARPGGRPGHPAISRRRGEGSLRSLAGALSILERALRDEPGAGRRGREPDSRRRRREQRVRGRRLSDWHSPTADQRPAHAV